MNDRKNKLYQSDIFSSISLMDEDVAATFVFSALSLDNKKVIEAFNVACQIMEIRARKKAEKAEKDGKLGTRPSADEVKALLDKLLVNIPKKPLK